MEGVLPKKIWAFRVSSGPEIPCPEVVFRVKPQFLFPPSLCYGSPRLEAQQAGPGAGRSWGERAGADERGVGGGEWKRNPRKNVLGSFCRASPLDSAFPRRRGAGEFLPHCSLPPAPACARPTLPGLPWARVRDHVRLGDAASPSTCTAHFSSLKSSRRVLSQFTTRGARANSWLFVQTPVV